MADGRFSGIKETAYESLFPLVTHYSSQIFRIRELIIVFILVVWAIVLGIQLPSVNHDQPVQEGQAIRQDQPIEDSYAALRPVSAGLGALGIGFFTLMEALYISLFWKVVEAGRDLEKPEKIYFGKLKKPLTVPFLAFYIINVALMLVIWLTSDVMASALRAVLALISAGLVVGALIKNNKTRTGR